MSSRYRLAAVFAHPDDDTYGLSGTYALFGDVMKPTIVVATSGGAGVIADPSLATPENLTRVREEEERRALAAAGLGRPDVRFLRYPDGQLEEVPRHELLGRVAAIRRAVRPHVVVTFGPEGVTLHRDHIRIGEVATEAFHRLRQESGDGAGPQRLLYSSIPQTDLANFWGALRARGVDVDPEGPFQPRGVPDETVTVRVDVRSVIDAKMRAIRAHATQMFVDDSFPQDLQEFAFAEEGFVQAWPPVAPGAHVLTNPFEGLDGPN